MKILIVSDTHRRDENLREVIEKTAPIDMLIHLGDAEGSEDKFASWVNEGCRLEMVLGNNDFFSFLDKEKEIRIGQYKVLLTHGHTYNVSLGAEQLKDEALDRRCDIVMYGHTHRPYLEQSDNITVLNPGSLSFPRQDGRMPSYMIMDIDDHGKAHYTINYIERSW